jgi:TetR/AcrR family transcriptional regulator
MIAAKNYTETEEKIFLAAIEEFAGKGLEGTRMQDIADKAGINKALVHYYFRSKERLYNEVFSYLFRTYFSLLNDAMPPEEEFAVALRGFINGYIDTLEQHPILVRFVMRELLAGGQTFINNLHSVFGQGMPAPPIVLIGHIKRAIKSKEINKVDPIQLIVTVLGVCVFTFAANPIVKGMMQMNEAEWKKFVSHRKDHIFNVIYNGIRPRTEKQS